MKDLRKNKIIFKGNSLLKTTKRKDLQLMKKTSNSVIKINFPIKNLEEFNEKMKNFGYKEVSKSFLVKKFNDIEINITRRNNEIKSITAYENDEIVDIPQSLLQQVKQDINSCL